MKFGCTSKAERWYEYIDETAFEYWDLVRCKPVYIHGYDGECFDNEITYESICTGTDSLWYPHRVVNNIFMF